MLNYLVLPYIKVGRAVIQRRWIPGERVFILLYTQLAKQGDERLKGSRFLWLMNEKNQSEERAETFEHIKHADLKVFRAWAIKELFRNFWTYTYAGCAKRHFDRGCAWAIRSRLDPIKAKARTIKSHLSNLLTYFKHPISNAVAEGSNSKIQTVNANARGYCFFREIQKQLSCSIAVTWIWLHNPLHKSTKSHNNERPYLRKMCCGRILLATIEEGKTSPEGKIDRLNLS